MRMKFLLRDPRCRDLRPQDGSVSLCRRPISTQFRHKTCVSNRCAKSAITRPSCASSSSKKKKLVRSASSSYKGLPGAMLPLTRGISRVNWSMAKRRRRRTQMLQATKIRYLICLHTTRASSSRRAVPRRNSSPSLNLILMLMRCLHWSELAGEVLNHTQQAS